MNGPPVLLALDALTGALFLLTALGVVATRQVLASLQLFILQSLLLTVSAVLLGIGLGSIHLIAVAAITIATKTLLIPWLLRRTVSAEVYRTREIEASPEHSEFFADRRGADCCRLRRRQPIA